MKRVLSIISCLILTLALGSCYKDKGDYSYHPINDITISTIADTFRVNKFDTLRITPSIAQSKGLDESHLKYEWSVYLNTVDLNESSHFNIAVLSTQRNLNLQVGLNSESAGPYNLNYKVTDTVTGVSYFKHLILYVSSAMQNGWMLLERKTDHSDISFISTGDLVYHNVFSTANPTKTLSLSANSITSVNVPNGGVGVLTFVLDDKDGWFMDKTSLQALRPYSQCFYGTVPSNAPGGITWLYSESALYTINNGTVYSMNALYGANLFGAAFQQPDAKGSVIAPFVAGGFGYGGIFFDQKNYRFLTDGGTQALAAFPEDGTMAFDPNNVHKQMLTMKPGITTYYQGLFKNLNNDSVFLYTIDSYGDPFAVSMQPVLNSPGVAASPDWQFSTTLKLMYYASGNQLYVYDLTANQSRVVYTFGNGENVTALQMRSGNLIVATYNGQPGGGSVYTLPLATTGEIQGGTYTNLFTGFEKIVYLTYKVG